MRARARHPGLEPESRFSGTGQGSETPGQPSAAFPTMLRIVGTLGGYARGDETW
jgi:hypothetical protein